MDCVDVPPAARGKRCRASHLHLALAADLRIVKEHAQWWGSGMKERWDITPASPVGGVGTAFSA